MALVSLTDGYPQEECFKICTSDSKRRVPCYLEESNEVHNALSELSILKKRCWMLYMMILELVQDALPNDLMCLNGPFGEHYENSYYIHTMFSVYKLYLQLIINPVLHFVVGFYER
ncbi:hypothetical protein Zmor_021846 [Zophobas morio]|uniref:Uncharacterized protein n=1 Tax=Zophobas morio TaxID=2755281 RepID=A0AA38MBA3_9CUCU|nr:hypothetical protein Zmor_021846 [Zophobas morio]